MSSVRRTCSGPPGSGFERADVDNTRAFYRRLGYVEQARVQGYWTDGDDLVLFSKRLTG